MRIGFVGNGALGTPDAVVRDGTVADRLALFNALEQEGHEVLYLAPPERSPDDPRVVGYAWTGELDALVVETRDAVWPPQVTCLRDSQGESRDCDLEHEGYLRCVHAALTKATGIPVYWQAVTLERWRRGDFSRRTGEWRTRPALMLQDFDLNVRRVFGLAGRGSTYRLGKFWRKAVPWMEDVLEELRSDPATTVLAPYDPDRSLLVKQRGKRSSERYSVERFYWAYPSWLETSDWLPLEARRYDFVYTGSDYDRRRRWDAFYGEAMRHGARGAVTGTWGNRRRGRDREPWNEAGYRGRLEEEFGDALEFLSPSTTGQLPFMEAMGLLGQGRWAVQVVPDEYARLGYYTNRVAECAARGVPLFVDAEIHEAERMLHPELVEEGFVARGWDDVAARIEDDAWARGVVERQRLWLRNRFGPTIVARTLVDLVRMAHERRLSWTGG